MKLTKQLINEVKEIINEPKNTVWFDDSKSTHHIILINHLKHTGRHTYCFNYLDFDFAYDEFEKCVNELTTTITKEQYVIWVMRRGNECIIREVCKSQVWEGQQEFTLS